MWRLLQTKVPFWLGIIVALGVFLSIAYLAWRKAYHQPTPVVKITREEQELIKQRMQEAFGEGKIPKGMHPVPPPQGY